MKIVDAGQYIALSGPEAGRVKCRITVQLDDGRQSVIPASEETVNAIIELAHGIESVEQDSARGGIAKEYEDGLVPTFGGNGSMSHLGSLDEDDGLTPEQPVPAEPPQGLGQQNVLLDAQGRPIRPRARVVDKDEMGYPIVHSAPDAEPQNPVFDEEEDPGEQI